MILVIGGRQSRLDDWREVFAHFTAAIINGSRTKKDRKVKPDDLFDREKVEERRKKAGKKQTALELREEQRRVQDRAQRLPIPRRLQERIAKVEAEKAKTGEEVTPDA